MNSKEKYAKSKSGVINSIWNKQLHSSIKRGHDKPKYSRNQFYDMLMNSYKFDLLFNNWVNSKYDKWNKPSIDRLDDYKGYSFDNIRIVTWKENVEKSHIDVYNGINNKKCRSVIQMTIDGCCIKEYRSASIAGRKTDIDISSILKVCSGKRKTAGGFMWRYK